MIKEMLEEYKLGLETADINDDQLFYIFIDLSISLLDLSIADIARMFDTSHSTVSRWIYCRNAPHPATRSFIYRVLLEKLKEKL